MAESILMRCHRCGQEEEPTFEADVSEVVPPRLYVYVTARCPACGWAGTITARGWLPMQDKGRAKPRKPSRRKPLP